MSKAVVTSIGIALLGGCAVLTGLGFTERTDLFPKGQGLPARDIVFILEGPSNTLGFIDADGTGFETRTVEVSEGFLRDLAKMSTRGLTPWVTWAPDGQSLAGSLGRYDRGSGTPLVIALDGRLMLCPDGDESPYGSGRSWIVKGTTLLTVDKLVEQGPERLLLIEMVTCSVQEVVYQVPQEVSLEEASISSQGWLAIATLNEGAVYSILVTDPQGTEVAAIQDGQWPAWSRDGEWLAYTVFGDGLYIARKDGSDTLRVVESSRARLATWSPDGEWLVYDRPAEEGSQGIYKVNLVSGEEAEIYRGGFNPNWNWRQGD